MMSRDNAELQAG